MFNELDVPSIDRTLRRCEEVLLWIEVRGELLMKHCPRCGELQNKAVLEEDLNFEWIEWICDRCWT